MGDSDGTYEGEVSMVPESLKELLEFLHGPLQQIATMSSDNGQVLLDDDQCDTMEIETDVCRELFLTFPDRPFHRAEVAPRFTQLKHTPCGIPRNHLQWRSGGFKTSSAIASGDDVDEKTVLCLFVKDDGATRLAARRTFVSATLTKAEARYHCKYLLHILLYQSDPLPVHAIPVAPVLEEPKRKKRKIRTVLTREGDELKFEANRRDLCLDSFKGFNENAWVDDHVLQKIVDKTGYTRCGLSALGPALSIGLNYRYAKVELSEKDGFLQLHCKFDELKVSDAAKIDLIRNSPILTEVADEPTQAFNERMKKGDKRSLKNECKAMLNSFIKIQNQLYRTKFKSNELAGVLLPEIEEQPEPEKKSEGLSFGIVFLIIALVAIALVAGFYVWRHYRPKQSKKRNKRSQRIRREISDI